VAVVCDNDGDAADAAQYLEVPPGLVQAAVAYYESHRSEIDGQIEANEQETAAALAAFRAGQAATRE
jgi:hypothetical protein